MLGFNKYGKANVRFLRVVKDTPKHIVHEVAAKMQLEGEFNESYETGNNRQIVPTDTMKNSLYAYAKKFNLDSLEEWSMEVAQDMMKRHSHISAVNLELDESTWERIKINGVEHNHSFVKRDGVHFVILRFPRNGAIKLTSGIKGVTVMKTTQSGFDNYIKDDYTTLEETKDRVFCTKLYITWDYNVSKSIAPRIAFNDIWESNLRFALECFAGLDPVKGEYSPAVQTTIFQLGKRILQHSNPIERVWISLPNVHYFLVNFKRFKTALTNQNEVFENFADAPNGIIEAMIERNPTSKL